MNRPNGQYDNIRDLWEAQTQRAIPYHDGVPDSDVAEVDARVAGLIHSIIGSAYSSEEQRELLFAELGMADNELRRLLKNPIDPDDRRYLEAWIPIIESILKT